MTDTQTPGTAAKLWAVAHPDFTGLLDVLSLTPAGKGGWMTKLKRTTFIVSGGKASLERWTRTGHNGFCFLCGKPEHKPILQDGYADDPHGGEAVAPCTNQPADYQHRRAMRGYIKGACADCYARHGLSSQGYEPNDHANKICIHNAPYAPVAFKLKPATVEIDIRQQEASV